MKEEYRSRKTNRLSLSHRCAALYVYNSVWVYITQGSSTRYTWSLKQILSRKKWPRVTHSRSHVSHSQRWSQSRHFPSSLYAYTTQESSPFDTAVQHKKKSSECAPYNEKDGANYISIQAERYIQLKDPTATWSCMTSHFHLLFQINGRSIFKKMQ